MKNLTDEEIIAAQAVWAIMEGGTDMDVCLRDIMKEDQQDSTFTIRTDAPKDVVDNVAYWAQNLLDCSPILKAQKTAGFIKYLGYKVSIFAKKNNNNNNREV